MKKNRKKLEEPSAPFWMVTFADMVTLLMTFFVLLLSFANMSDIKFEQAAHSLKGSLGILKSFESLALNKTLDVSTKDMNRRMDIYESMMAMEEKIQEMDLQTEVSIQAGESSMLIQMGDQVLFDLGKADLKPEAFKVLDLVGKTIGSEASEVLVGGHTDNNPIHTLEFPSNWELSASRALRVAKYLTEYTGVPPEILGAVGYSEYKPIVQNNTPENQQKNRRVEFLVTWK
ncbi:OmpA family protein [Caldithrix abyssi]|nr:OmpA family protein [Caldithrix abyssi]